MKNPPLFSFGRKRSGATGSPSSRDIRDIWRTRGGAVVALRTARAGDGPLIQALVQGLSMESRYHRFFYPVRELDPALLARFTRSDPARAITLLATAETADRETVVAMAQYVVGDDAECADFAVVVADDRQREGIGRRLIETLTCIAREAGVARMEGDILAENKGMLRLMLRMGFTLTRQADGAYLVKASKMLEAPQWKCSPLAALAARAGAEA